MQPRGIALETDGQTGHLIGQVRYSLALGVNKWIQAYLRPNRAVRPSAHQDGQGAVTLGVQLSNAPGLLLLTFQNTRLRKPLLEGQVR